MPLNKADVEQAKKLAALDYASVKPVIPEMLRWLRTYRVPEDPTSGDSLVADVFIEFFISNAAAAAEEVEKVLNTSSRQSHLKYVIVTRVLPQWPRFAVELVKDPLVMLVMDSSFPETALMALQLLAKHNLSDKKGLKTCLDFIAGRMERNLREAHQVANTYF